MLSGAGHGENSPERLAIAVDRQHPLPARAGAIGGGRYTDIAWLSIIPKKVVWCCETIDDRVTRAQEAP
jgi:hypothetical protein